ncbi:MAG: hypothetical protein ACP5KE_07200 [Candidatus Methanodesulfokora sp.]
MSASIYEQEKLCLKLKEWSDSNFPFFSNSSSAWIFLATHGMWSEKLKGEVRVTVDALSGETTLIFFHEDYGLIRAVDANPVFHMSVEKFAVTKKEGKEVSPVGVHIRMKKGEIERVSFRKEIEVTPLTFHAATSGIHRSGISYRIMAFQQALSRKISEAILQKSDVKAPYEVFSVDERHEMEGSLISLISGVIKWSKLDAKAVEAELTTSVLEMPSAKALRGCYDLLSHLLQGGEVDLSVVEEEKKLSLKSKQASRELLEYLSKIVLGRLNVYKRVHEELKEGKPEGEFSLAIDFSEQMGPCDAYLLLSILSSENLMEDCRGIWLIATPLSYPAVAYTLLYLKRSGAPDSRMAISSEDPALSRRVADRILEFDGSLIYIAAGPTSHVLSFAREIMRRKEKIKTIPLSPHFR